MSKAIVYDDVEVSEGVLPFVGMSKRDVIDTLLCGAGVGIFVGVLYLLLDTFVFSAVLCRPQNAMNCAQGPAYAMIVATVIGAIAGLVALARVRIYRPLFIVLFATVSLWVGGVTVSGVAWYVALITLCILYALAYLLFAWLARIRSFILASVLGIIILVLVRLAVIA